MTRDHVQRIVCLLTGLFWLVSTPVLQSADRPSFVWLISEDNSVHYLKLYNDGGAATPRIAELARHGLLYEHAFSNSPVCSVARTTLMTGCYAPRIGTQFHRKTVTVPMPEGLRMFPAYLREQGYYASNNQKKDYNAVEGPEVWDESSRKATWRNRQPGQPFFHMQSFKTTHESSLHFADMETPTRTDPEQVEVAPYHPNTPTFRYTNARYRDNMGKVDQEIGAVVDQLEQDGLLEQTFIFYFGDHGGVLPRGKGYIYESGLHVPLVIRVPKQFQHLVDGLELGSRREGFVSFVDFGPTLLSLAGITPPPLVDGKAFLGSNVTHDEAERRDEAYGYADRFDEKYDLVRTLRKGPFKYMRSYQPFNFDGLHNNYRYKMLAYQEWRSLYHAGKLNDIQKQFFEPRAAEALYDVDDDPHETTNLADNIRYQEVLRNMRSLLTERERSLPDLSFYPESFLVERAYQNPVAFGRRYQGHIGELIDVANVSLDPLKRAERRLPRYLDSGDRWTRYWALVSCSSHRTTNPRVLERAKRIAVNDPENLVRVRAAEYLALVSDFDPGPTFEQALASASTGVEGCLIMNSLVLLKDGKTGIQFTKPSQLPTRNPGMAELERRLLYLGWND